MAIAGISVAVAIAVVAVIRIAVVVVVAVEPVVLTGLIWRAGTLVARSIGAVRAVSAGVSTVPYFLETRVVVVAAVGGGSADAGALGALEFAVLVVVHNRMA